MNRKLIWLPCRHHIFEIILKGVFKVFWPTTSGPNVPIFGRFKNFWSEIDQSKYQSGMQDELIANTFLTNRLELINLINNLLKVYYYFVLETVENLRLMISINDFFY